MKRKIRPAKEEIKGQILATFCAVCVPLYKLPPPLLLLPFFGILLFFFIFSNRQIHTFLVLLVFHSQKVNLRVGSWKSIRQRVSPCNRTTLTVIRSHEISLALLRGKNYMNAVACVAAGFVCASPSELGLNLNDCSGRDA